MSCRQVDTVMRFPLPVTLYQIPRLPLWATASPALTPQAGRPASAVALASLALIVTAEPGAGVMSSAPVHRSLAGPGPRRPGGTVLLRAASQSFRSVSSALASSPDAVGGGPGARTTGFAGW